MQNIFPLDMMIELTLVLNGLLTVLKSYSVMIQAKSVQSVHEVWLEVMFWIARHHKIPGVPRVGKKSGPGFLG